MICRAPSFSDALLAWYDENARLLPWRKTGGPADPYHVWISEVMLQQTTVATVIPYFQRFMAQWPTLQDFAAASEDDVLRLWQGLGYYTRAHALRRCAQILVNAWGGHFPRTEQDLLTLPGIGPYTAAAISTIAFEVPAVALDGNILRVLSRYAALPGTGNSLKTAARQIGETLLPPTRVGDYTQALMDLGATICIPRSPKCSLCPVRRYCTVFQNGQTDLFPHRAPKISLPQKYGHAFWIERRADGAILFQKESERRLLAGLLRLPISNFEEALPDLPVFPLTASWTCSPKTVSHTFTHFKLTLQIWWTTLDILPLSFAEGIWIHPQDFSHHAFSTLMRKIFKTALEKEPYL